MTEWNAGKQQVLDSHTDAIADLEKKIEQQYGCIGCIGLLLIVIIVILCVLVWEYAKRG